MSAKVGQIMPSLMSALANSDGALPAGRMSLMRPSATTMSAFIRPSLEGPLKPATVTAGTVALLRTKRAAFGGDMKE